MRTHRIVLFCALLLAATEACYEQSVVPTLPEPAAPPAPLAPDAPVQSALIPLACSVEVRTRSMTCEPERGVAARLPAGASPAIIIGGQNVYLRLTSQATSYDAVSSVLSSAVSIKNLISQPLGTADGFTPDANGVRVFFHAGPTVTGGTGTVTVRNPDGSGTFTASGQPYFAYTEIILGNVTSSPKTWQFLMPSTVTNFTFSVYVQATLRDETLPLVQPARSFAADQLAAGNSTTCAIRSNSGVYCWGSNANGRLGIGVGANLRPYSPATGPLLTGLAAAPSSGHTCGLNSVGAAFCWGLNDSGQLGDGTLTTRTAPNAVTMPIGVTFVRVFVGGSFSCGLTSTGNAYCWGSNTSGQYGDGSTTYQPTPTLVGSGLTFSTLAPGANHMCGLTTTSVLYCWGLNSSGQLGDGTTTAHSTPATVTLPGGVTVSQLVAGNNSSCVVSTAGTQYCWGNNSGIVGDGSQSMRTTPGAATMPSGVTFSSMSVGASHGCAVTTAALIYCSGSNTFGQLGDGTGSIRTTPTSVIMPNGVTFSKVVTGGNFACGLGTTGSVYCWGQNSSGQVGDASINQRTAPVAVSMPSGVSFVSIVAGSAHACGTTADSLSYCWGATTTGQLGNASVAVITLSSAPVMASATHLITTLATGPNASHACGLTSAGAAYCWGINSSSQLGDATTVARSVPTAVTMPVGVTFGRIGVGTSHSCALSTAGAAYCWGLGTGGQIGNGSSSTRTTPVPSTMPVGVTFSTIANGGAFSCALPASGAAFCWGTNSNGQVGDGSTISRNVPTAATMPTGVTFSSIALGSTFACGLASTGVGYCWGNNAFGQLGDATTTNHPTPATVLMPAGVTFTTLAVGVNHACATTGSGDVYCWGNNANAQLGDGTTTNHSTAALVTMPSGVTFTSLTAGASHTCGMTSTNVAYCWGLNASGQLGDGTLVQRTTAVPAILP